jgi:hypothetical protein
MMGALDCVGVEVGVEVGVGVGVGEGVGVITNSAGSPDAASDALKSAWPRFEK